MGHETSAASGLEKLIQSIRYVSSVEPLASFVACFTESVSVSQGCFHDRFQRLFQGLAVRGEAFHLSKAGSIYEDEDEL